MRYIKKFNESKTWTELVNETKELIYTIEDIFVELKDMGCDIEIFPDPEKNESDFDTLVYYINDKLDFSDPDFKIYIKDGNSMELFFKYKEKANQCLKVLKKTIEPFGLYVTSAKRELINPNLGMEYATIIKISKP